MPWRLLDALDRRRRADFGGLAGVWFGSAIAFMRGVRCDQPRVIDLNARNGRKVDTLPAEILDEVLAKVALIFE